MGERARSTSSPPHYDSRLAVKGALNDPSQMQQIGHPLGSIPLDRNLRGDFTGAKANCYHHGVSIRKSVDMS